MADDSSHFLWLSTHPHPHPHPPISASPPEAVLAQRTVHATGESTKVLQHAHARRSQNHSRSNGTTATPIHSLYASHLSLTTAPMQSHPSRSSTSRRVPSPLVRHHSSSSSSGGNASAAESFTSYTHMAGHFRQPTPGIPPQLASNYSVVSLRGASASRPSTGDSIHNAPGALSLRLTRKDSSINPGVTLADSLHASSTAGQVQRVDVKRLMSKPRALLPPSSVSSHSIPSITAYPNNPKAHAKADTSLSEDETADRKATIHPVDVRRRRRSRTLDELMLTTAISVPTRPPLVTDPTSTPTTPTIPTPSSTLRPRHAASPSFTGETTTMVLKSPITTATARPKETKNTTTASTDYQMQRTTVWLDNPTRPTQTTVPLARQAASLDLHRTAGGLTPASALVLAWNESQRRQPQPLPDSAHLSPPVPSPGKSLSLLPPSQNLSDADTRSYGSGGHASLGSVFDSSTRGAKVVAVGGPEGAEDPYRVWAMVEEKLRQTARTSSSGGNPIKGLKRRVTGRFSRGKDKNKEGEKEREKRSESMGALPPSSVYPATSSRLAMPQRQKTEHGLERRPAEEDMVIPHPRGSSLTALSVAMGSRRSWGDTTNSSNPTVPESESYRSQVTPTRSAIDANHHGYANSPVPGSESSQTPATSVRVRSKSPAPPPSASEGDVGRLWKLVRKLSNGALTQRIANEQGDSLGSLEDVPPVPALPKDFDLIDHRAYISERQREHAQENSPWLGRQFVASPGPVENPRSSGTQSTLTMQSPPVLPTPPPSTSSRSPPLSTMPTSYTQHVAANINTLSPHPYPPRGKHGNKMPDHKPSSSTISGNSASMSGNEYSFRSISPGFSSSDITSSKVMTSPYSQRSSVSSSSELHSTSVAIARPIMPPEDLLRMRYEDSFARQRAQSDTGHSAASSGRVQPRGPRIHIKHNNKSAVVNNAMLISPTSPPPPSSSPVTTHPLPAPPRRQTLGTAPPEHTRAQARHGDRSPGLTTQALSRAKSMHDPLIPRPHSSPSGSPLIPCFANDRPANMFDDHLNPQHARSTSLRQSDSFAPLSSSSPSAGDSLSPRSRIGSSSSINALSPPPVRRRAPKTNRPLHGTSSIARHAEGSTSSFSSSAHNSFPVMNDHYAEAELEGTAEKGKRPRLDTSSSLLTKARSRSVKSSSALRNPESSGIDPSPMTAKTEPTRSSHQGKQKERSKSYVEVGRVPFTATAFAFRDLNHDSPAAKPTLTEKEREDRWAALLARSDRAGGTLTARLEGGVLMSDTMSITED